jgi:hypothetical protein
MSARLTNPMIAEAFVSAWKLQEANSIAEFADCERALTTYTGDNVTPALLNSACAVAAMAEEWFNAIYMG